MPKAGEVSHATNTAADVRTLPWKPAHIAAADAAAKAVFELLGPLIHDDDVDTSASADAIASGLEPCGSYLLRTSLNAAPEAVTSGAHSATGCPIVYPLDVTLALTDATCSMQDVDDGKYLDIRREALGRVRKVLDKACRGGFATTDEHGRKAGTACRAALVAVRTVPVRQHPMLAGGKDAVVARFEHAPLDVAAGSDDDDAAPNAATRKSPHTRRVFFDVTVHTRPVKVSSKVSGAKAVEKASTAWYANLVLEDHYAPQHLEKLHALVSANQELSRAIVLGKLWARHVACLAPPSCALSSASNGAAAAAALAFTAASSQGVSGFVLTAILAGHAGASASGSAAASTTDAFLRLMWMSLSGLTLAVPAPGSNLNTMHAAAATVPDPAQLAIRRAAELALKAPRGLGGILSQPHPTHAAELFDAVLSIRPARAIGGAFVPSAASASTAAGATADGEGKKFPQFPKGRAVATAVHTTLVKALGERIASLRVSSDENASTLTVAVTYKSEGEARNRLVRGAPIEDRKAVDAFNELWGPNLTTSRQFADGGVFRCVLWPTEHALPGNAEAIDVRGAAQLTTLLVAHLVGRHHVPASADADGADQRMAAAKLETRNLTAELLDVVTEPHDALGATWADAAPLAGIAAKNVVDRVSQLVARVAGDSFPCVVKSVDAVSDNARATAPFALLPNNAILGLSAAPSKDIQNLVERGLVALRPAIEPIHCVVVIDDKHKIPDSLDAIATMKGAIAAQLAKALTNAVSDDVRVLCAKASVDVVIDGYVVRLHIGHYREVSLLQALDRVPEAMAIERRLFRSGQHARYIDGVIGTHVSARGAMRLLKRWLGAACLTDYVLPEALELIVASVYTRATWDDAVVAGTGDKKVKDAPDETGSSTAGLAPRSAAAGFLRALRVLADAPALMARPVVLSDAPSDVRRAAIAFKRAKEEHPEQALFIAAPYALEESPYTVNTPRGAMVERLAQLAAASLRRFAEACGATTVANAAAVDAPPTAVAAVFDVLDCHSFDAVLPFTDRVRAISATATRTPCVQATVSPLRLGHPWAATKAEGLSNADLGKRIAPLIEREPAAAAVRALRAAVREEALLFYDGYAPTAVGVALLRKRKATLPIEWEQTHGAAIAAVPPPPMDGAFSDAVPHALPEAAGAIKRALAAAPGLIVSPHLLKQQPSEKAAKKKGGPGKQPRAEAADTEAEAGSTPTPKGKMHRAEAGNGAATPAKSEDAAGSPAARKSKKGGKNGGASPTVAADTAAATATPKAAASTLAKASPAAAAAAATPSSAGKKKSKPTPKSGKKK